MNDIMMLNIPVVIVIMLCAMHVIADFALQTRKMAENKSKSIKWLSLHAGTYSCVFILISWQYALLNGILHWVTDYVTSRLTSKYWEEKKIHTFFLIIGIDQFIHISCLIGTYALMVY